HFRVLTKTRLVCWGCTVLTKPIWRCTKRI
ncbi:thiamine pyrophosphate enzyme, N-terminal TPP binding domain protein, partial [Vibrio parahaemolyticus V-223/04]